MWETEARGCQLVAWLPGLIAVRAESRPQPCDSCLCPRLGVPPRDRRAACPRHASLLGGCASWRQKAGPVVPSRAHPSPRWLTSTGELLWGL